METLYILMTGMTAVILFVFGLEHFSQEIEKISGEHFRKSLSRATNIPILGVLIGAAVTAVIQSSSATSVITISLVNAGVLSFKSSVGIIFGSNIGTTITAQLVAFKLTSFAPMFIILGFLLSLSRTRYAIFGKAIFYFGFVFFSLNLISSTLSPLQNNAVLIQLLTEPRNPLFAILFGCVFTSLVQSSSVTTGLAIIFTQQGLISIENAVPLLMGANIGTTATALIAVFSMDIAAKKTALSHFLFNAGGVLIFTPIVYLYSSELSKIAAEPAVVLASIHLVFNVATSLIFLALITPFTKLVDFMLGDGEMDFERLSLPSYREEDEFDDVRDKMEGDMHKLLEFLQENYNLVTLSVETNYQNVFDTAEKRIEYIEFVKKEYMGYLPMLVSSIEDESQSRELIQTVNQFDYLFQIHDSIDDLFNTNKVMKEQCIDLKSDLLVMVRDLSSQTLKLFEEIHKYLSESDATDVKSVSTEVQEHLYEVNKNILSLLADPLRKDAGALTNFFTYSQRLKDKLVNFHRIQKLLHTKQAVVEERGDSITATQR